MEEKIKLSEIMGNLDKNRRSTIDFEPYGVELPPFYQIKSKLLYTEQERDYCTNYDYSISDFTQARWEDS